MARAGSLALPVNQSEPPAMKAKIENLRITVNGKVIELTLEEAKELQKVLNETLSPQSIFPQIVERVVERPVPHLGWSMYKDASPPGRFGEITCKAPLTGTGGIFS